MVAKTQLIQECRISVQEYLPEDNISAPTMLLSTIKEYHKQIVLITQSTSQ
jgi:hypothetical protein